jgi:imidazolonepropionase-like amidohydrolase
MSIEPGRTVSPGRTVLHGASIFDGTGTAQYDADLLLADGKIVEIGTDLDGDTVIDLAGHSILPGLFDCHVHVTSSGVDVMQRLNQPFSYEYYVAARNLKATLNAGVTTVRDAGGADLGIQHALRDGLIEGPRMLISVGIIGQTGGHSDGWHPSGYDVPMSIPHPNRPSGLVDGPDEMRRVVRRMLRAGANVIKVCATGGVLSIADDPQHAQLSRVELDVAIAEAAAVGVSVMAHAQGSAGIKNALLAGVRSIEHGIYLDDESIELMLQSGTWLVPTLVAPLSVVRAAENGASVAAVVVDKAREVVEVHRESVRRAASAGVRIAMGTDSGVGPHGENTEELTLMHACGMSIEDVLYSATGSAADLCGLGEVTGRLRPGLAADLVVVKGALDTIADLDKRITAVWQAGRPVVGS